MYCINLKTWGHFYIQNDSWILTVEDPPVVVMQTTLHKGINTKINYFNVRAKNVKRCIVTIDLV